MIGRRVGLENVLNRRHLEELLEAGDVLPQDEVSVVPEGGAVVETASASFNVVFFELNQRRGFPARNPAALFVEVAGGFLRLAAKAASGVPSQAEFALVGAEVVGVTRDDLGHSPEGASVAFDKVARRLPTRDRKPTFGLGALVQTGASAGASGCPTSR